MGVRNECARAGLPVPASVRLDIDLNQALAALDSLGPEPVGVVCYNDDVATALLSAAKVQGRRVPADIAIIGMDHTPLSQVTLPRLTTVAYNTSVPSQNFITAMLGTLRGSETPVPVPADIELKLIPGDTT